MVARGMLRIGVALLLGWLVVPRVTFGSTGEEQLHPSHESALLKLSEMRRSAECPVGPTSESVQEMPFRGRPSLEIAGRAGDSEVSGGMRDFAVFDLATSRIVSYICFSNASTRRSGEAIVSLAEVSTRADRRARAILPGLNLELESVKRHRTGDSDSIYYEAHYAAPPREIPFFAPPVRLLLNASTGSFFRLDVDPDWLDPLQPPRARISRKASERIAAVVLGAHDLATALGPGAVFGTVSAAELFTVHPNDWLGLHRDPNEARARIAWVVPFRALGAAGVHSLFVDAATGFVLGGQAGPMGGAPAR